MAMKKERIFIIPNSMYQNERDFNRKRILLEFGYFLYFFILNFIIIKESFNALIKFPLVLILIIPYFLLTLINPVAGISVFIVYHLIGLKALSPSYGTFLSLSILAELCLVASLFIKIISTRKFPSLKDSQSILLFLFIASYLISSFFRGNLFNVEGGGILKGLILMLFIYILIVYFINSRHRLLLFFRSFILLGLIWFAISIIHILKHEIGPIYLRTGIDTGYFGTVLGLNILSTSILMILPIIYYQLSHEKIVFWKVLSFICFPLVIFTVMLTFSRNGFICLVIVLFLIFNKGKISFKTWSLVLIVVLMFIMVPSFYWSRMATITSLRIESGLRMKIGYFLEGINIIRTHPVIGVGYGNSFTIHNTILQVGADLGLPVLLLFLSIIFIALKDLKMIGLSLSKDKLYDLSELPWMLIISLIAYIIGGLTISIPLFLPFIIILAIIAAIKNLYMMEEAPLKIKAIHRRNHF